ncbi:hypothetical protein PCE1_001240 [Barthelona sp. PCE]
MNTDLLHPDAVSEANTHKLKRLVPTPNSVFLDAKCASCGTINCVFSHATTTIHCQQCQALICTPTGGRSEFAKNVACRQRN